MNTRPDDEQQPASSDLSALAALAAMSTMPTVPERVSPPWEGKSFGKGRCRKNARSDEIAFRKRVAKRRAKKGYK